MSGKFRYKLGKKLFFFNRSFLYLKFAIFLATYTMSENISKKLFIDNISDKEFTKTVDEWFTENAEIDVSVRYQRKKCAKIWWSNIVYCIICKKNYKLKGSISSLKQGLETDIMVSCQDANFCECGRL